MINKYYHSLIKKKSNNIIVQLFRHTISGGIAFLCDFCTLYILTKYMGWSYQFATILGYIIGIFITYIFSVKWIFHQRNIKNKTLEITVFIGLNLIGLALNSLFMWMFTSLIGIYVYYSKIITTGIIFFWNFYSKKLALFSSK